jgi:hypothetical protein
MAFPNRSHNWIADFLLTSSSHVILNGVARDPIAHGHGLRQDDPLSPLLFIFAIDPSNQILNIVTPCYINFVGATSS